MANDTQTKMFGSHRDAASTQPVECLGIKFPNDEARRQHFLGKLREKLKNPAFRKIDGFPKGDDDDILALSDPPYYTACPNPFVKDVVNSHLHASNQNRSYHREPYAFDVSEGKGDQSYYIHSYHTKVPPTAVGKYISHYADDNGVIVDCFSGSGMTGLGAALAGKKNVLTLLLDLSPASTFISYFHNCFRPQERHFEALEQLHSALRDEFDHWYSTPHTGWLSSTEAPRHWQTRTVKPSGQGRTRFVVWSTVVSCPECGQTATQWDLCVDLPKNASADVFHCPSCKAVLVKERKYVKKYNAQLVAPVLESVHDLQLGMTVRRIKRVPVLVSYDLDGKRYEKAPSSEDLDHIRSAETSRPAHWCPTARMPEGDESRRNDDDGITHSHQFFPARTLHVLASAWDFLGHCDPGLRGLVTGILTRCSLQNRYMPQHRGNRSREVVGPLSGTLYIPYFSLEINPVEYLYEKGFSALRSLAQKPRPKTFISTHSASSMGEVIPPKSIDYSFIDPPFGSNLQYSELSFIMESWFRVFTASTEEAVVNDARKVGVEGYCERMRLALSALTECLKPGRWTTVEFHNSQNAIWSAIQVALIDAGLVIADVRTLDKKKGTTKQLTLANAVQQDLVITAYRPTEQLERLVKLHSGETAAVWEFVRSHLGLLPVFVETDTGGGEVIAERQNYLLFDRTVAFFVQRGIMLPISAAEFYEGLRQKFAERDGMYFLSEQVPEYDRRRLEVNNVEQFELFVTDEKSAIHWVRRQLEEHSMTYKELAPLYMREAQRVWEKHEQPMELRTILEENFVEDANGSWRVPNPKKEADLEQLRNRGLMREFQQYLEGKGKLKVIRTEALRAGFKDCWQKQDYSTIVQTAKRIPEAAIQEDSALLMYYDNALMRTGS